MKTDVAVVGGGPVGLGLAIDLGQRGVEVVLVERDESLHRIPKGQNLTQRTMEHFRVWGVEDRVRAARLMPPGYPAVGVNAYGDLMSAYAHPWFRRSEVDRYYFARNERLPQYLTEGVLRDRLAELPSVTALYGTEAVSVDNRVSTAVVETDDGNVGEIEAQFVVGCDGSHSLVRETAGISESRSGHDRKMVLVVFRSTELHRILGERFGEAAFFNVLHPDLDGYWRFLGRVDVGESWFFHAPVEPDSRIEDLDVKSLLAVSVGVDFDFTLDHIGFWDLRIAFAQSYRRGRILIAGDAAHSHPPYGGYGINTGLEDARNLAWKLVAVMGGWGGESLLDSYSDERRAVFASTARDFISAFIADDRDFITHHDPRVDEEDFARAWQERRVGSNLGVSEFEPHYEGSSIVFGPPGGESSAVGKHSLSPRAGHHLPPIEGAKGDLFESLGSGFCLIASSDAAGVSHDFSRAAQDRHIPLRVAARAVPADEPDLILVRPDHFVCWTGEGSSHDADRILARVVGI